MKYASFVKRFTAFIIDSLIITCTLFALTFSLLSAPIAIEETPVSNILSNFTLSLLYFSIWESSPLQATIGKRLLGIKVTGIDGHSKITFISSVIRNVVKFISGFFLMFGHFLAFFSPRRQALHDNVAKTLVIEGNVEYLLNKKSSTAGRNNSGKDNRPNIFR